MATIKGYYAIKGRERIEFFTDRQAADEMAKEIGGKVIDGFKSVPNTFTITIAERVNTKTGKLMIQVAEFVNNDDLVADKDPITADFDTYDEAREFAERIHRPEHDTLIDMAAPITVAEYLSK